MRRLILLCLAAAACTPSASEVASNADRAATEQDELTQALAGYTPEAPQTCLTSNDRRIGRSRYIGDSTILYTFGGERIIRNDMNGDCAFRRDPILVSRTPSTQLCRGDIAQLVDRASRFPIGSCAYGDFVTYRKAR